MSDKTTTPMDTPGGRKDIPAAPDRLHGADRSGDKGWSETPDDLIGRPSDTNVQPELHEPISELPTPADRDT